MFRLGGGHEENGREGGKYRRHEKGKEREFDIGRDRSKKGTEEKSADMKL